MFQEGKKDPQRDLISISTINTHLKSQSLHSHAALKSSGVCGSTESSDFQAEDIYFSSSDFLKLTEVHSLVKKKKHTESSPLNLDCILIIKVPYSEGFSQGLFLPLSSKIIENGKLTLRTSWKEQLTSTVLRNTEGLNKTHNVMVKKVQQEVFLS